MNRFSRWVQRSIAVARLAFLGSVLGATYLSLGQEASIPLVEDGQDLLARRSSNFWKGASARRALQSGLYEVAQVYAEEALGDLGPGDEALIAELGLLQVDALLGRGLNDEARSSLARLNASGPLHQAKVLREAILALVEEDEPVVSRLWQSADDSNYNSGERAWHALIRGWLDLKSGDLEASGARFDAAKRFAGDQSPGLAAQIALLAFRYQMESSETSVSIEELRLSYEANRGLETGFRSGQLLAVALFGEGRNDEAIEVVNAVVEELPEAYSDLRDQFLLLQLLLTGADSDIGQNAARRLIVEGVSLSLQRIALQHLISENLSDEGRLGEALLDTLDSIVDQEQAHPLAAEALYYRGVRRYQLGEYSGVEDDANRFMDTFPDSPYRRGVLTLLASSSWQKSRFRTAASYLSQAGSEFPESIDVEALSVLIADCYFRAGMFAENAEDFASAADAYEIALGGEPDKAVASQIFFQLVLSHLNADAVEAAKAILDDSEQVSKLDSIDVWRAEWMLVKQMRRGGEADDAYDRIGKYLNSEGMGSGLQLRMLWLGSKLAYESGRYGDTSVWVDRLNEVLGEVEADAGGQDRTLLDSVRSDGMLTLAESLLRLGEEEEGLALLVRLREEFEGSESAERSYIVEAGYLSSRDLVVEAGQLLTFLFDTYPGSKYAPLAIYLTAMNAEKRGLGEYLTRAMELLDRIASDYPESDLVYRARLKQGDLLRRLNLFGTAEIVYEQLENLYPNRPDRYLAQISLADTLIAQASEDPSKFEAGISRLELLMDLPNVPIALRVEAGYKRGNAWENKGESVKAKAAYFDLYDSYVVEEMRIDQLGEGGQYWLSRAMFKLAEMFEDQTELDRAIEFYEEIEALGLFGDSVARTRKDRLMGSVPFVESQ